MNRRVTAVDEARLDTVLAEYLGRRKVASRQDAQEPFPVYDPLEKLQGEALRLATAEVVKTARQNGLVSGVEVELERFLDIKTASRGFARKSDHLVSAQMRYAFCSELLKARGLEPLHLKVAVAEGAVLVPLHFEEGYEFSREGVQDYCDQKEATYNPACSFFYKSASTGQLTRLGSYLNPQPLRKEFQRRDMSITAAMDNREGLCYVVMGPDQTLPVARTVCASMGQEAEQKVPKHLKPAVKDAFTPGEEGTVEEKDTEHPLPARLKDTFKRAAPTADIEDLSPGDMGVEDERIQQLVAQRRLVAEWLVNGGGAWDALAEECEEQFEDSTYAIMRLQQIIWDLAQSQPVWAWDPQGEPFRVRRGADVTGSDKIWIEHETRLGEEDEEEHDVVEHAAQVAPLVAPPAAITGATTDPVATYLVGYIKKQGSTSDPTQHPRWVQLVAAVSKDKSLGQPLTDEYLGRQVRAYLGSN